MRRTKPESVHTLLQEYLRLHGLEAPLKEQRLLASWSKVAGEVVARHTRSVKIYNQTLYVSISSAAIRSELMMQRPHLVAALNEAVGSVLIYDLKVS